MAEIPKEKLAEIVDVLIDTSADISKIVFKLKGIETKVDELSTEIFFHYKKDEDGNGPSD